MTGTLNLLRRSDGVCPIARKEGYIFVSKKRENESFRNVVLILYNLKLLLNDIE